MASLPPAAPSGSQHNRGTPAVPPAQPPTKTGGRSRRFASLRTVVALILREMSTRYGRTPGGYIWAVLEPLAAILFLSLGFSLIIRTPSLGTSFLLFYATGYLPFDLYMQISNACARALRFSKPLLKYPAVTWLDAIMARLVLNSLTSIFVMILLLTGILMVIDSRTVLDMPPVVQAVAMAILLGAGVGTLNCVLMELYPLWSVTWGILTRPLFLASGIFFLYDDLPPLGQDILWYNPLMHITGLMRTGFYPSYTAAYVNITYVTLVSLVLLFLGLVLMGRYHRDILNR
ncbi:ABC transporter permease [Phaeobacter gallaeciensis]|uniref:ABC transporter permease n=1 Tax=Phaeobacter gallaeciensis TaxID=60890 RepID=UPI00237F8057|nr:ABC transporter permease [Phaeobacter gallaeciensis]MDE4310553.1 ABC transporter permease [Phaeobacter gallaeciensis]MDE4315013.1 ABC transporter permease [Phaeobacter gallaeciensis]MDE4319510.1 ABC transporter permease [Phaeobacter gallaeciensis]MDE4323890.1 ABC transporter permease [Phaeobacter gallaeciensis]MDE4328394.1 ABC transporter permease [Phaeobacter gallaeciensis]